MAKLSVVATPIGNLEDITLRALRVLREVDCILCEDTRVTKKLLTHYEIDTRTKSYHTHSSDKVEMWVLEQLASDAHLALVSDAGTPAISDPGVKLVARVREELPDVTIEVVPGASAVTAALSISGFPSSEYLFLGFLPHKKGRETLFAEIAQASRTVVFYESPHRIDKTLEALVRHAPKRRVLLARELTKLYEECLIDSPAALRGMLVDDPNKSKGEFVVLVAP